MKTLKANQLKPRIDECEGCSKITPKGELAYNAKFGGYGFRRICDNCADLLDNASDSLQQSKG